MLTCMCLGTYGKKKIMFYHILYHNHGPDLLMLANLVLLATLLKPFAAKSLFLLL